jgi:hypothetical protein
MTAQAKIIQMKPKGDRLLELCKLASKEKDSERLLQLIEELITLLPEDPAEALFLLERSKAGRKLIGPDLGEMT